MKSKLAVAMTTGILALGALASLARADFQCAPGGMIEFDADCFAYESNYNSANYTSATGSQLNVVGIVALWCAPFADLEADRLAGNNEYTFLFTGLTALAPGTVVTPNGPFLNYETHYSPGTFLIYQDPAKNAPTHLTPMPPNPPNATVPVNFVDGTLILQGTLSNFVTQLAGLAGGVPNGGFGADYQFTGPGTSTYYQRVAGTGVGLMDGSWCVGSGCVPQGYSAQPNGKFDQPPTPVHSTTWGTVKQLYR